MWVVLGCKEHCFSEIGALRGKSENATASDLVYSNTLMKDVQINNSDRSWRTRLISSIKERGQTKQELEAIRLFKTNL
jgi:hypothetical protein